jgi:hypothetical protein
MVVVYGHHNSIFQCNDTSMMNHGSSIPNLFLHFGDFGVTDHWQCAHLQTFFLVPVEGNEWL